MGKGKMSFFTHIRILMQNSDEKMMNCGARILRGSKTEDCVKTITAQCYKVMHE